MPAPRALICCSTLMIVVTGLMGSAGRASERVDATYALWWGGLEIAQFEIALTADAADYRIAYAARTTGLVGVLFPFDSAGASEGQMADPGPMPERFTGESERRAGRSSWAVAFHPDGEVARVDVTTAEDEQRDPVPLPLRNAPDPLVLALRATQAAAPGVRFEDTSFDGKRAVRFELACDDTETPVPIGDVPGLEISGLLSCTLDGEVAAGQSRRWQSGRDPDRKPAEVLLSNDVVPGRYWPVRVEAETRYGRVIAQMTELR